MHNLLLWIVYYFVQKIFIFFNKTSYGSVSKYFNWEFENLGVFLFRLALALIYWDFIFFIPFTIANLFIFNYGHSYLNYSIKKFMVMLIKVLIIVFIFYLICWVILFYFIFSKSNIDRSLYADPYSPFGSLSLSFLLIGNLLFYPGLKIWYDRYKG